MMQVALAVVMICLATNGRSQDVVVPISVVRGQDKPAETTLVEVTLHLAVPTTGLVDVARLRRGASNGLWQLDHVTRTVVRDGRLSLQGEAGLDTLVWLRPTGQSGYLLHGPFTWPSRAGTIRVGAEWRRTVRGASPDLMRSPPTWVGAGEDRARDPWPVCSVTTPTTWECVGAPFDGSGVVVHAVAGRVIFSVARGGTGHAGVEETTTGEALWGRLLVVNPPGRHTETLGEPPHTTVTARRLRLPRNRTASRRLDVEDDDRTRVERVSARAHWVSGTDPPGDGWIDVGGRGLASARVSATTLAEGSPELPLNIAVDPAAAIAGRVATARGVAAPGAIVTVYRFDHEPRDSTRRERRIAVAEQTTDADGAFRFEDLAVEPHEIVALHSSLGRGERRVEPDGQEVEVRLRPSATAVGRVVRDGLGVPGVQVAFIPDLSAFQSSHDVTELRGGATETDRDGRFRVALPARGTGEIRIGGEAIGVRRVALAPAESLPPIVDIGTISLGAVPSVILILEASERCELLLTGPAGRTGLAIIRPSRIGPAMFHASVPEPGRWHVVAVCAGHERAVLPPLVTIAPDLHEQAIRLTWPHEPL